MMRLMMRLMMTHLMRLIWKKIERAVTQAVTAQAQIAVAAPMAFKRMELMEINGITNQDFFIVKLENGFPNLKHWPI